MDPIGLSGGLKPYGKKGGDPINFGDPFGLCPDSLKKGGECPGGLKDDEWDAVEATYSCLSTEFASRLQSMLYAGDVRAFDLGASELGRRTEAGVPYRSAPDQIFVNRGHASGNFFFSPRLGFVLSHELGHVELFKGMTPAQATASYEKSAASRTVHEAGAALIGQTHYTCSAPPRMP